VRPDYDAEPSAPQIEKDGDEEVIEKVDDDEEEQ
jgi:hypothetical protein